MNKLFLFFTIISLIIIFTFSFKIKLETLQSFQLRKQYHQYIQQQLILYNISNYQLLGLNYLHSIDTLNQTLHKYNTCGDNEHIFNTTYKLNQTHTYIVQNAKPIFNYRLDNQSSALFANDTFVVENGYAQIKLQFQWKKLINNKTVLNGSGIANSTTAQLIYAIGFQFIQDKGFIFNSLLDYYKPFINILQLSSINQNITIQDKTIILSLLTKNPYINTIKQLIQDDLQLFYPQYLVQSSQSLHPINLYYQNIPYTWPINSTDNYTFQFHKQPSLFNLTSSGIRASYLWYIKNYTYQQFDPMQLPQQLNTSLYGDYQYFTSYNFYKYFIYAAMKQNLLNKQLLRYQWATKNFKFYAGQLYDVFSDLQNISLPFNSVKANCYLFQTSNQNLTFTQLSNSTFGVLISWRCRLQLISISPITYFQVKSFLEISAIPNQESIDFWIKQATIRNIQFYDLYGFKLINKTKAQGIISDTIERLTQQRVIGSGWKYTKPMKNPVFVAVKSGTYVADK